MEDITVSITITMVAIISIHPLQVKVHPALMSFISIVIMRPAVVEHIKSVSRWMAVLEYISYSSKRGILMQSETYFRTILVRPIHFLYQLTVMNVMLNKMNAAENSSAPRIN